MAPSFASFRAVSRDLTLSIVARNRFSSFGNSHRKSALSRTSCHTHRDTNVIWWDHIAPVVYYNLKGTKICTKPYIFTTFHDCKHHRQYFTF